jgi:hypothetical protein
MADNDGKAEEEHDVDTSGGRFDAVAGCRGGLDGASGGHAAPGPAKYDERESMLTEGAGKSPARPRRAEQSSERLLLLLDKLTRLWVDAAPGEIGCLPGSTVAAPWALCWALTVAAAANVSTSFSDRDSQPFWALTNAYAKRVASWALSCERSDSARVSGKNICAITQMHAHACASGRNLTSLILLVERASLAPLSGPFLPGAVAAVAPAVVLCAGRGLIMGGEEAAAAAVAATA